MDKNTSTSINILRLFLTIMIIIFHAYTVTQTVEWLKVGHPIYKFFAYNLSLLWGNLGVPIFFFLSGYLFFIGGKFNYYKKLQSRFWSLFVPYLLWNILTLAFYYMVQQWSVTSVLFSGYHKPVADYSFMDFIRAFWDCGEWNCGNNKPILSTYWFVRNLLLFSLLSPLIYGLNKFVKYWWIIIAGIVWLFTSHVALSACSIFCIGAGSYMGMNNISFHLSQKWFRRMLVLWIISIVLMNILWWYCDLLLWNIVVSRLFVILSFPLIYYVIYQGVSVRRWKVPVSWISSTFFVYSFHIFFITAFRKYSLKLFPNASDWLCVALYFISIVVTFFVCYGVYRFMKYYFPRVTAVLCGNRS